MAKYKFQFIGETEVANEVEGYIGNLFFVYTDENNKKVYVPLSSLKKIIEIEPNTTEVSSQSG